LYKFFPRGDKEKIKKGERGRKMREREDKYLLELVVVCLPV
jgi:hypothetical protein